MEYSSESQKLSVTCLSVVYHFVALMRLLDRAKNGNYLGTLHPVNNYYATEQIVHVFDSIYNIRLNVIQDKVDIIGANYIKCSGAWAVILKAIAFFA